MEQHKDEGRQLKESTRRDGNDLKTIGSAHLAVTPSSLDPGGPAKTSRCGRPQERKEANGDHFCHFYQTLPLALLEGEEKPYAELRDCDVQHASHHDQSIKGVPRVDEVVLRRGNQVKVSAGGPAEGFLKVVGGLTWARRASSFTIISTVKTTVKIMLRMSMTEVKSFDCS